MPRPHRPGYFAARKCWRFMLDGKRHYICRGIPPDERPQRDGIPRRVWDEMDRIIRAAQERLAPSGEMTFYWLIQTYVKWVRDEVDAGRMVEAQYKNHRSHFRRVLALSGLRDVPVSGLAPEAVDLFFSRLGQQPSPRTGQPPSAHYIHNVGKSLRSMLRWASRPMPGRTPPRLIPANPLEGYAFPRQPGAIRGYLESDVMRRFLRWAWGQARWAGVRRKPDPETGREPAKIPAQSVGNKSRRFDRLFLLILRFQRLTGCHPGEACRLEWAEIQPPPPASGPWEPRLIEIAIGRVKTRKQTNRPRKIHVTAPVARILRAIERLPDRHERFVFTHMLGPGSKERRDSGSLAGEPWPDSSRPAQRLGAYRRRAIAAGLPGIQAVGPKRLVAYANRHSFASEGSSLGFSDEQISEQLGNTPNVLRRVYAHAVDDVNSETARQIAERRRQIGRLRRPGEAPPKGGA